jgi:hypothetical protein
VEFAVIADDAREKASCAPEEKADTERTYLSEERTVRDFDGPVSSNQGLTRLGEEELTVQCKSRTAGSAIKERAADLTFEIRNLLTDGRLRDMQLATGFAEGAVWSTTAQK